jgi:hypothetical protein
VPDATGVPHLESDTSIHDAAETSISVTEETLEAENIAPAPVET